MKNEKFFQLFIFFTYSFDTTFTIDMSTRKIIFVNTKGKRIVLPKRLNILTLFHMRFLL